MSGSGEDRRAITAVSASKHSGSMATYSLNVRRRSGSITSIHFHQHDGADLKSLGSDNMGHVYHYSATANTLQRHTMGRDVPGTKSEFKDFVRNTSAYHNITNDVFNNASTHGEAGQVHAARNVPSHAALDKDMDDYFKSKK